MDTEKKDNLTDVVESVEQMDTPEDNLGENTEQTVVTEDGEAVTLDQKKNENK
jgi:hypothetical protein